MAKAALQRALRLAIPGKSQVRTGYKGRMRFAFLPATLAAALVLMGCGAGLPARAQAGAAIAAQAGVRQATGAGPFVFIGGGADQDDVMRAWAKLSNAPTTPLVVFPLASNDPPKSGQAYVDYLGQLGFSQSSFMIPHGEPTAAEREAIARAGGFFFSGGDQSRILSALTPSWRAALRDAWKRGAAIAGTSAGAMVWGGTAILGGDAMLTGFHGEDPAKDGIRLGAGLGLVDRLVVDTHFGERGRLPRVAYTLGKLGGGLGIGSDPKTAAVVRMDGRIEVVGRGTVTIVRAPAGADVKTNGPLSVKGLRVEILAGGDTLQVEPLAATQAP